MPEKRLLRIHLDRFRNVTKLTLKVLALNVARPQSWNMASDKNRCRAPRRTDALPCRNFQRRYRKTCRHHRGFPRIPLNERGPKYLDGYHDHLRMKARGVVTVHPVPHRIASDIDDAAIREFQKLEHALSEQFGSQWLNAVDEQADRLLQPQVAKKTRSRAACRKCAALSRLARQSLETNSLPPMPCLSTMLMAAGMPCIGVEDLLITDLSQIDDNSPVVSPATAARAMQVVGIQACKRWGKSVYQCYCARDISLREGDQRLKEIMRLGSNNWENLGQLDLTA